MHKVVDVTNVILCLQQMTLFQVHCPKCFLKSSHYKMINSLRLHLHIHHEYENSCNIQKLKLSKYTLYIYLHKLPQLLTSLQIIAKTDITHNLVANVCEVGIKSSFPFPSFKVVVFQKIQVEYLVHLTKVGQNSSIVVMGTIVCR